MAPLRITRRAQDAVLRSHGEAFRLGHDRVGTEHLLLALLRDQECLAVAALSERGVEAEAARCRVEQAAGPGQADAHPGEPDEQEQPAGLHLRQTRPVTAVFGLAAREARGLKGDRVGTEHLLLGLAREGDGVAARVLDDLGAGLLELREAVRSVYAAGTEPEPLPADRGPPAWEPPAGAELRRVVPLSEEHLLPSGDRLVLVSLELWSDWLDLRYAIAYAAPEPEGDLPRPWVLGRCEVSDRVGTGHTNWTSSSPAFGMVRTHQHTFVPAPPPGAGAALPAPFGRPRRGPAAGRQHGRPLKVAA